METFSGFSSGSNWKKLEFFPSHHMVRMKRVRQCQTRRLNAPTPLRLYSFLRNVPQFCSSSSCLISIVMPKNFDCLCWNDLCQTSCCIYGYLCRMIRLLFPISKFFSGDEHSVHDYSKLSSHC